MCLQIEEDEIKKVRRRFRDAKRKGRKYIICYKYLHAYYDCYNKFQTLSPHFNTGYDIGWNISNRGSLSLLATELSRCEVDKGIHVYTTFFHLCNRGYDTQYVKVKCYEEDFVSAGNGEAVFMKVYITREEWRAFKRRVKKAYN